MHPYPVQKSGANLKLSRGSCADSGNGRRWRPAVALLETTTVTSAQTLAQVKGSQTIAQWAGQRGSPGMGVEPEARSRNPDDQVAPVPMGRIPALEHQGLHQAGRPPPPQDPAHHALGGGAEARGLRDEVGTEPRPPKASAGPPDRTHRPPPRP
jgi:hypothetical protein